MLDDHKPEKFFSIRDIWQIILLYLNADEIEHLKQVCKAFNTTINDPVLDCLWMPYLNRLHAIDPTISLKVEKGKIHAAFLKGVRKINREQMQEINYLLKAPSNEKCQLLEQSQSEVNFRKSVIKKHLSVLADIQHPVCSLQALEERHEALDLVNCEMIRNRIKIQLAQQPMTRILILSGKGVSLTRLPASAFKLTDYQEFWQKVITLHCSEQNIRFIDKSIIHCSSLQHLYLGKNCLTHLPEELGQCKTLVHLGCENNQLMSLPSSLGQLKNLTSIDFSHNLLQSLPNLPINCEKIYTNSNYS